MIPTRPRQCQNMSEQITPGVEDESGILRLGTVAAGVDLLPGPDGEWYVLEVNAVPGWRALAPVCGIDVAAEMVKFIEGADRG